MLTFRQRRLLVLVAIRSRRRRLEAEALAQSAAADRGEVDRRRRGARRRFWVHPIVARRPEQGDYEHLYMELRQDEQKFQAYFRLSVEQFDWVLDRVRSQIEKQDTAWRDSISPAARLAICLR